MHIPCCKLPRTALPLAFLLFASRCFFGCSSDTDTPSNTNTTVVNPPSIVIQSPSSNQCASLHKTPSGESLTALFRVENWNLRPKGFCSGYAISQCGFAAAYIDIDKNNAPVVQTSSLAIEIPRDKLPSGSHTLRIELRTDDGAVALGAEGQPLVAEVTFTVPPDGKLSCSDADAGSSDAGADAPSDASGDSQGDTSTSDAPSDASGDSQGDTSTSDAPSDGSQDVDSASDAPSQG